MNLTPSTTPEKQSKPPRIPRKAGVDNAEALRLVESNQKTKAEVVKEGLGTWAGLQRAAKAEKEGRPIGKVGRSKKLYEEDEEILVNWIQQLLDEYGSIYRDTVIILATYLCEQHPERPLKNKTVSRPWVNNLIKRYPQFTLVNATITEATRKDACTQDNIRQFMEFYAELYNTRHYNP